MKDKMNGESLGDCFTGSAFRRGEKRAITFLREGKIETEISYLDCQVQSGNCGNLIPAIRLGSGGQGSEEPKSKFGFHHGRGKGTDGNGCRALGQGLGEYPTRNRFVKSGFL